MFVERFKEDIPDYMLRHKVKAGITGWAQINGWRGNTSLSRRIECDLYYIRHWSYLFDFNLREDIRASYSWQYKINLMEDNIDKVLFCQANEGSPLYTNFKSKR